VGAAVAAGRPNAADGSTSKTLRVA
jgi:hypothetical protein